MALDFLLKIEEKTAKLEEKYIFLKNINYKKREK